MEWRRMKGMNRDKWGWIISSVNPFIPIHLTRDEWVKINPHSSPFPFHPSLPDRSNPMVPWCSLQKIEPLFFLDYSANMYSRKILRPCFIPNCEMSHGSIETYCRRFWCSTMNIQQVIQEKQGIWFFAGNCREFFFEVLNFCGVALSQNTPISSYAKM